MSGPYRAAELEPFERGGDRGFLLARADIDTGEILRALRGFQLREVDHIHRRPPIRCKTLQRLGQRQFRILMRQRNRPVGGRNRDGRTPGEPREFFLKKCRVAQRRGHQEKARVR